MYRESDIMHENGKFWVLRRISRNAQIAAIGSTYYEVFETGITHSTSTGYITAKLHRAVDVCNRRAAE